NVCRIEYRGGVSTPWQNPRFDIRTANVRRNRDECPNAWDVDFAGRNKHAIGMDFRNRNRRWREQNDRGKVFGCGKVQQKACAQRVTQDDSLFPEKRLRIADRLLRQFCLELRRGVAMAWQIDVVHLEPAVGESGGE